MPAKKIIPTSGDIALIHRTLKDSDFYFRDYLIYLLHQDIKTPATIEGLTGISIDMINTSLRKIKDKNLPTFDVIENKIQTCLRVSRKYKRTERKNTKIPVLVKKKSIDNWDIEITRMSGSIFANQFLSATYGRNGSIRQYKSWFTNKVETDSEFKNELLKLEGKILACVCDLEYCHGRVIIEYFKQVEAFKLNNE